MNQLALQCIKSIGVWLGLFAVLVILAALTGFFTIEAPVVSNKIAMGIYSPLHAGMVAYFNPLAFTFMILGGAAFLLTPLALLVFRKPLGVTVRPWLLSIAGFFLLTVIQAITNISPKIGNSSTKSLWPQFSWFLGTVLLAIVIGFALEYTFRKRTSIRPPATA